MGVLYLVPHASSFEYFATVVPIPGAHGTKIGNIQILEESGRGTVLNMEEATVDLLGTQGDSSGVGV